MNVEQNSTQNSAGNQPGNSTGNSTENSTDRLKKMPASIGVHLSTGFGVGLIPFAPGTFGSLWGLVIVAGLDAIAPELVPFRFTLFLATAVVLFFVGIPICNAGIDYFQREDPPSVIFDELAVFPLVFCFVPWTILTALLGFGLFRLFDIWKPYPISELEKCPKGWGVMLDDTLAGIFAAAALWGMMTFLA